MIAFRLASRVTLTLGLACSSLAACGSSDADLFGTGNEVDANAGDGGQAEEGSGGAPSGGHVAATGGAEPTGGKATGGSATGGNATGGSGTGGGSIGGKPGELSCADLSEQLENELESIQACKSDEECGQPLEGTSCGCTRNLVARKDADIGRFQQLFSEQSDRCDGGWASTCDCPAADGFKCSSNRCGWNYQSPRTCTETKPGQLCLKRDDGELRATLEVGEKLAIRVQPIGCFSSSCTEAQVATCSLEAKGNDFVANAEFCMADTTAPGGGCTADCSVGFAAECESELTLTKGEHTVSLGDVSLTFTVPGVIPEDALCAGSRS